MLNNLEKHLVSLDVNKTPYVCYLIKIPLINSLVERDLLNRLSSQEMGRAKRISNPRAKFQFIYGRAVLREILRSYLGKDAILDVGRYGKPFLSNGSLQFNVSHSNEMLAIALSNGPPIGVDIEEIKEIPERGYFNDFSLLPSSFDLDSPQCYEKELDGFYLAWSRREAVMKALGLGLAADTASGIDAEVLKNISILQEIIDASYSFSVAVLAKAYRFTPEIIRLKT